MNDFEGLLSSTDYGFKPQGKSAPMSSSRSASSSSRSGVDPIFNSRHTNQSTLDEFGDVFGGPPTTTISSSSARRDDLGFNFDYVSSNSSSKSSSMPVFDKPLYDDDVGTFDNVFASSVKSDTGGVGGGAGAFDNLLDNLGGAGGGVKKENKSFREGADDFHDLIPGFGGSSNPPSSSRQTSEVSWAQKSTDNTTKTRSSLVENPFVVLESSSPSTDPLEELGKFNKPGTTRSDGPSDKGGIFNDLDPLDSLGKSFPKFSSEVNDRNKERSPSRTASGKESTDDFSAKSSGEQSRKNMSSRNYQESRERIFDMPSNSNGYQHSVGPTSSPPSYEDASPSNDNSSRLREDNFGLSDDIWLTVSEVPLYTQPTTAPPPTRPPPSRPGKVPKSEAGGSYSMRTRKQASEFPSFPNSNQQYQTSKSVPASAKSSTVSPIDELEDFAMGGAKANFDGYADVYSGEDVETPSDAFASAAAMKEAMDKAEAKFRHAKELRERENAKASRSREGLHPERVDKSSQDSQERLRRETEEKLENEQRHRQWEEEEREQRRLQQERERAREIEERDQRRLEKEREREKARQAVERATREARERAAAEARLKAERAAVEKVNAQARERAERAAVQRAQAEARERAAAEAKERAEKAAAEAKERAEKAAAEAREKAQESRLKAERAAAERATAEARERAAAQARERAAAQSRERAAAEAREKAAATAASASAKATQQKNEDDLESFFGMGSRPSSAPRTRTSSSDPFDSQFQTKQTSDFARWASAGTSSSMKKASSATNIVDDLSSIFGAAPSSFGEFQEVEGETEERRRARLERQQRTQERAAKALAEKNQRDLQAQRDQAERHRIAETLDVEIKRWAAGKEGNLRALLSTMQYVMWPECGWQPVSLTDLITAAAVKKVYRKATLCIHPDKVQQKGATLQQKYIAEKVFDLLKEAWNKFNSEELF